MGLMIVTHNQAEGVEAQSGIKAATQAASNQYVFTGRDRRRSH